MTWLRVDCEWRREERVYSTYWPDAGVVAVDDGAVGA